MKRIAFIYSVRDECWDGRARIDRRTPGHREHIAAQAGETSATMEKMKGRPNVAVEKGKGGTADLAKKDYSTYVLTTVGVSATATIGLIRAQLY